MLAVATPQTTTPPPAPAPPPSPRAAAKTSPRASAPARISPRVRVAAPRGDRCAAARQAVESAGLHLAAGYDYRCPGSDFPRWGATTLSPCGPCFVSINTAAIGSNDATLRYAVAHEFCHSNGIRDEQSADACAASYGFPNRYFRR